MIVYADITFINNFLMTLAIVWAVGHLLEYKSRWWKLVIAALIGTFYTFIVLVLQTYYLPNWLNLVLQLFFNLFTAILMVRIAFGKKKKKQLWKGVGYLYLVSFITIGTTLSIFYIYGGTPFKPGSLPWFIILGLLVLILVGKYGWKIFQKYITPDVFYVPVNIFIKNRELELVGLIDTGNNLTDPLTQVPVIIVALIDIAPIFSSQLQQQLLSNKGDILDLIEVFNENGWENRVRILPFSGLGQEHGILVGIRPDKIKIKYQENLIETDKVIIALSKHKLDDEDEYQALIHPQIMQLKL